MMATKLMLPKEREDETQTQLHILEHKQYTRVRLSHEKMKVS